LLLGLLFRCSNKEAKPVVAAGLERTHNAVLLLLPA
jgi:hypothetical protein